MNTLRKITPFFRPIMFGVAFLGAATACWGQAPGGVTSNLSVWYKADLNVVGDPIDAWNTSGGCAVGYQLTQGVAAYRPCLKAGDMNYKLYNYNPRVGFDAANLTWLENTSNSPDLYGTDGSIFLVSDHDITNATGLSYSANLTTQRIQLKPTFRLQTSTGLFGYTADFTPPTEYPVNSAAMFTIWGLGSGAMHRLNSFPIACSFCGVPLYNPSIALGLHVGRNAAGAGGEYLDGELGEIIFYKGPLTTAEVDLIESYLAVKYGITRGGNMGLDAAYNYVSANGTIIWDKPLNTGYNNDIAGIGRDDASALIQRQSISVNVGESASVGLVSLDASNASNGNSFDSDDSFLLWGNNGLSHQTDFSDPISFMNLPPGIEARIQRIWKSQATNFSQLVTVGFELSALVGYMPIGNLRLLVDDDGTDWSNAVVYSDAVLDGNRIEFAGVTLNAGRPYFTLATTNYLTTPLPIQLLYFSARPAESDAVQLDWATASETNNAWFDVERSWDDMNYESLGGLPGAGNSLTRLDYRFMDRAPLPGTNYYRIKQVDLDGAITYTEVRAVTMERSGTISVFPSPASDVVHIVGLEPEEQLAVELFTAAGAQVTLPNNALSEGLFDVSTLPQGVYLIRVGDRVTRFVKE